jgi:hypothetical protein
MASAVNSKIGIDWTGGTVFVDVAKCVMFTGPDLTVQKSPAWHLLSAGAFKDKAPGMVDGDDLKATLRFTKAQFATFLTNLRKVGNIKIFYADAADGTTTLGSSQTFLGFLSALGAPTVPDNGDQMEQQVSIACNSTPVFVAGTG